MPRAREFDEGEVLERAMRLFWREGFDGTSLDDLLAVMQLSKSSFYATFGSKHDLLLEALRRYRESWMHPLLAPLRRPGASRAEIEEVFGRVVDHASSPEGQAGCFLNNCAVEVAPHDPIVRRAVRLMRDELESALRGAVDRGQSGGAISKTESPDALARFLATTLSGINVLAKSRPNRKALDDVARIALRSLD